MRRIVLFAAALATFVGCGGYDGASGATARTGQAKVEDNPMGLNGGCYVCHMTFVDEPLTVTHLKHDIGCTYCHGTSAGHANDENIGNTPPDVMFERTAIDAFCLNCHKGHDIASEKMRAHWHKRQKDRPTTRPIAACTDCHDTHRIGYVVAAGRE